MRLRTVRHKGLKRFIEDDNSRSIRPDLADRIRKIVAALIVAQDVDGVKGPPGWRVHGRSGRDVEHLGFRQLADHLYNRGRFGGLSLMSGKLSKVGMKPPHPGDFIRTEILEPLGLDVTSAARALDVRRATLSDLVNGKAGLSPEMALRIEKAFGVSMHTLLRMQAWWDASTMREKAGTISVQRYTPSPT
jgi:addiction module HigA family antidote